MGKGSGQQQQQRCLSYSVTEALAELRLNDSNEELSIPECQAWMQRILSKIQMARTELQTISHLCEELTRNASTWSCVVLEGVLSSGQNHHHLQSMEIALHTVELAVASDSAIIDFFEVYLQDLDRTMEQFSQKGTCQIYRQTMQVADDMATTAARYTKTLSKIATFNQVVLKDMEGVVKSYMSDNDAHANHALVQEELHDMTAKIGVGLMMVAEMAWKWNALKCTKWNTRRQL